MVFNAVVFALGMSLGQAKQLCPTPLVQVYETRKDYYACDDGKNTTVLAFDASNKIVGVFDLKWYVQFGQLIESQK